MESLAQGVSQWHARSSMITCRNLSKQFRIYEKEAGFLGSLSSIVRRRYRLNAAVAQFDLDVGRGEVVGLLGPNGAGKTTLMKMLTGIIVPSSGHLRVLGFEPAQRAIEFRRRIALVMGQKSQLWWDIPALDSFMLLRRYYELDDKVFRQRLDELSELLDVQRLLKVHVRKLSLGERMKLELMASLLHEPEIMFLDEPTIGLDVVAQRSVREFLRTYQNQRGTTIILTSHYMADVEALCRRIVLVNGGRKHFDGPINAFASLLGRGKVVTVTFAQAVDRNEPVLSGLQPVWSESGRQVELRIDEAQLRPTMATILERLPVTDFTTEAMPVERVMATLLSRSEPANSGVDSSALSQARTTDRALDA